MAFYFESNPQATQSSSSVQSSVLHGLYSSFQVVKCHFELFFIKLSLKKLSSNFQTNSIRDNKRETEGTKNVRENIIGFFFQSLFFNVGTHVHLRYIIINHISYFQPGPASTVEERLLRKFVPEGTVVRISPRGFYFSVAN